ncbi:hypothetical protein PTKIN_Ptkin14bG0131700 [Pterospermum kingtungense]
MKEGMIWKIGDGSQIKVWEEAWVPGLPFYKPMGPLTKEMYDLMVMDLTDLSTRCWRFDVIDMLFTQEEAKKIKAIPISKAGSMDQLVWRQTKHRGYSVKSGYHFLQDRGVNRERAFVKGDENTASHKGPWKTLWKTHLPPKVKMFGWRICNEILPVNKNLQRRKIVEDPLCGRCKMEEETVIHAIRDCPIAQEAWSLFSGSDQWLKTQENEVTKWLSEVTERMNLELIEEGFTLLWSIWRNREIMNRESLKAQHVVEQGMAFLQEFRHAHVKCRTYIPSVILPWKAPEGNLYKVNFDGVFKRKEELGGIGVVIRDTSGLVTGAMHVAAPFCCEPDVAEATAAMMAVRFAKDLGLFRVIVEGDALRVINAVNSPSPDLSEIGNIIEEVRWLCRDFQVCHFVHVSRHANMAAHTLAKAAIHVRNLCTWVEECPDFIRDIVNNEAL